MGDIRGSGRISPARVRRHGLTLALMPFIVGLAAAGVGAAQPHQYLARMVVQCGEVHVQREDGAGLNPIQPPPAVTSAVLYPSVSLGMSSQA